MKKIRTIRTFFIKNPHIPYISEIIRTIRTFKKKKSVQSVQKRLIFSKTSKTKNIKISRFFYHSFSFVFVCEQRLTLYCFKINLNQMYT